ncbi:MAG TPA: maleylpyruvate isomerase N-terminal domain-containing protein, partial [Ktedonobacterales bacterium]|nr:maleylpyruvate isomerase N-terminal domain-containing protein [Ktedonobacterales bacterium]
PETLHTLPGADEWTLAELLAHLAEFPRYFADDLALLLRQDAAAVGRTHEHPERLAAVAAAHGRTLASLRADLDAALDALARQLDAIKDEDLSRTTQNRKYGAEPLRAFLDRYVLSHKAGHLDQLRKTQERVQGDGQPFASVQ